VSTFNAIMNGLFDLICFPFQKLNPVIGLVVISLAAGVLLLLLFKYTSPQETIKKTKDRLWGNLHEIRLFQDDLGVISRAIVRLFKENALYLGCCSLALLPMLLVMAPILFQLDSRYGFEPLKAGQSVVLDVTLGEGLDPVTADVRLELPEGLSLEAGPVRAHSTRELLYRLRVEQPGEYLAQIHVGGETYTKRVDARAGLANISPGRYSSERTLDALMYPAEPPFAKDAPLDAVSLRHARAAMLGMDGDMFPWLIIFCVVGLLFGFAMKGVLKVNL